MMDVVKGTDGKNNCQAIDCRVQAIDCRVQCLGITVESLNKGL